MWDDTIFNKTIISYYVNFHALWQLEGELYLPQDIIFRVANQHAGKKSTIQLSSIQQLFAEGKVNMLQKNITCSVGFYFKLNWLNFVA